MLDSFSYVDCHVPYSVTSCFIRHVIWHLLRIIINLADICSSRLIYLATSTALLFAGGIKTVGKNNMNDVASRARSQLNTNSTAL